MNKLSKREKGMLIMLGIIAAVGLLFVFAVKPIIDTAASNKAVIADLKMQTQEAEIAVAMKPAIEKRLANATEFIATEGESYYAPMANFEAERRVAKFLYDNKVGYHAVSIKNPKPFQLPPKDGKQVDPKLVVPSNGIDETEIIVECHTNRAEFHNLLNTLYLLRQKGCISSWEYSNFDEKKPAEGEVISANVPTIKALVTFKLYSILETQ